MDRLDAQPAGGPPPFAGADSASAAQRAVRSGSQGSSDTVVEALRGWCGRQPDKILYTWLDEQGDPVQAWSYQDLEQRANAVCHALLHQWDCRPGDRAALMYLPGLEFIAGFWGCLFAGVIAVPVYPVDLRGGKFEVGVERFGRIVAECEAKLVLSHGEYLSKKRLHGLANMFGSSGWPAGLEFEATDGLKPRAECGTDYEPRPDQLAFLQFTSGSTGDPKGVMLSHGNLVHNVWMISRELGTRPEHVGVSWVPQYHDMGLIGVLLQCPYVGAHGVLMSPMTMLANPLVWLKACSQYAAHQTCGMNGMYAHAVKRIRDPALKTLDLTSLCVYMSGGEPVQAETVEAFASKYEACGLRRGACYPCLGMAENVPGGGFSAAALGPCADWWAVQLVSCGKPGQGVGVRIVDPEATVELRADRVGEIWVSGPSKAQGYWGKPELSRDTFQATIKDDPTGTEYLRTGDLGFIHEGELYVCGRLKDLIIIQGKNYYPQDIEQSAERNPSLRPGCAAAFGMDVGGEEALVLVAEVRGEPSEPELEQIMAAVHAAIATDHQLHCHATLLLKERTILKTTSGKIRRKACRQGFLDWQQQQQQAVAGASTASTAGLFGGFVDWATDAGSGDAPALLHVVASRFSDDKADGSAASPAIMHSPNVTISPSLLSGCSAHELCEPELKNQLWQELRAFLTGIADACGESVEASLPAAALSRVPEAAPWLLDHVNEIPLDILHDGTEAINRLTESVLARFDHGGVGVPLDGPLFDSQLAFLGLSSIKHRLDLSEFADVACFVGQIRECILLQPILITLGAEWSALSRDEQDIAPDSADTDQDVVYAVQYCFLLHAVAAASASQPLSDDNLHVTVDRLATAHAHELSLSHPERALWDSAFLKVKSASVKGSYTMFGQLKRDGHHPSITDGSSFVTLQENILMAVYQDMRTGNTDNAKAGFDCILAALVEPGAGFEVSSEGDLEYQSQILRSWNSVYASWNASFAATEFDSPIAWAKLLAPIVSGSLASPCYLHRRVEDLYLHTHWNVCNSLQGISRPSWKFAGGVLASRWGRLNQRAASQLLELALQTEGLDGDMGILKQLTQVMRQFELNITAAGQQAQRPNNPSTRSLVSCGVPGPGIGVKIVDPESVVERLHGSSIEARIAIVGCGIAGLVCALKLSQEGFCNIVMYERESEVGGKVHECEVEASFKVELGAGLFGTATYSTLADAVGVLGLSDMWGPSNMQPIGISDGIAGDGSRTECIAGAREKAAECDDYVQQVYDRAGLSITDAIHSPLHLEHATPVGDWLRMHGLFPPPPIVYLYWTSFGYGFLEHDVPMCYFLKYLGHIYKHGAYPGGYGFRAGNQEFLRRFAARLQQLYNVQILKEHEVLSMERASNKTTLHTSANHTEQFDIVVLACPSLQDLLPESITRVLPPFKTYVYVAAAVELLRISNDEIRSQCDLRNCFSSFFPLHCVQPEHTMGHVVFYIIKANPATNRKVILTYQYTSKAMNTEYLYDLMSADLLGIGLEVGKIIRRKSWDYFPHFESNEIKCSMEHLRAHQGQDGLFFTGSCMSFELTESAASDASFLIKDMVIPYIRRLQPQNRVPSSATAHSDGISGQHEASRPAKMAEVETVQGCGLIREAIKQTVLHEVHRVIGQADLTVDQSLVSSGLSSMQATEIAASLSETLQLDLGVSTTMKLPTSLLLEHSTVSEVAAFVAAFLGNKASIETEQVDGKGSIERSQGGRGIRSIRILGMSCSLAGGTDSPNQLWSTLMTGDSQITRSVPSRCQPTCKPAGGPEIGLVGSSLGSDLQAVLKHSHGGFSADMRVDMHIQLLLDTSLRALADAGLARAELISNAMGVFTGSRPADFVTPVDGHLVARFVASALQVSGPHQNHDFACSSGYLAIHHATQALKAGHCPAGALASGVSLLLKPDALKLHAVGTFSASGRMRPFDMASDGMVCGEAGVALVLQAEPLWGRAQSSAGRQDATKANDSVRATMQSRPVVGEIISSLSKGRTGLGLKLDAELVLKAFNDMPAGEPSPGKIALPALELGDRVVAVDGVQVQTKKQLQAQLAQNRDSRVKFTVERSLSSTGGGCRLVASAANCNNALSPQGYVDRNMIQQAAEMALAEASIGPERLAMCHPHAMGKRESDIPELAALLPILAAEHRQHPLVLAGHKANYGHSLCAAGVISVVVSTLVLRHSVVPVHLGVTNLLVILQKAKDRVLLPVEHPVKLKDASSKGLSGSVSGHSISGDNVHLVLSQCASGAQTN